MPPSPPDPTHSDRHPRRSDDALVATVPDALIHKLLAAGDDLANALRHASIERPKPAPCTHAIARDDRRCPSCVALSQWVDAAREVMMTDA